MTESAHGNSRAAVVLGMHRSGTSLLTRGLKGLGIYLGDDFLDTKFDNPTGYWENASIVGFNERLLTVLGLDWERISLIEAAQWKTSEVECLASEVAAYLQTYFLQQPLWGFKDPRTIRLLPFWRTLLQGLGVDDRYVIAIRHPLGVAASLLRRQNMAPATAHMLSLVYLVPYLKEIAEKPFVVVDYDRLVADPRHQLARIARVLEIPTQQSDTAEVEYFSKAFLDTSLRHSHFYRYDFDTIPWVSPLIREVYLWLYRLAADELEPAAPEWWSAWGPLHERLKSLIAHPSVG